MRLAGHEIGPWRVGVGDSLAAWDEAAQIGGEEQRGDGHGADCQLPRGAEAAVDEAGQERPVEAEHRGQAGGGGVCHALGDDHEADGDASDDVVLHGQQCTGLKP